MAPSDELATDLRYYGLLGAHVHGRLPLRPVETWCPSLEKVEAAAKTWALRSWERCVGLLLVVSLLGRGPAFPNKRGAMDRSLGNEELLAHRAAKVGGASFAQGVDRLLRVLRLRSSPASLLWSRRHFKVATLHLVALALASRRGTRRHAPIAAMAFAACIGQDRGAVQRPPLYPDQRCLLALAIGGCLRCEDVRGGRAVIAAHIRKLLRAHRPHAVDLALLSHFQISVHEVEEEARKLAGVSLDCHTFGGGCCRPPLPPRQLVSLLRLEEPEWWGLPAQQLASWHMLLRQTRQGTKVASDLVAWAAPAELSFQDVLDAMRAGTPRPDGVAPSTVLTALRRWRVTSASLPGGSSAALAYARALLRKPRSYFVAAVGVVAHFRLAESPAMRAAFEADALAALALLVKSDRRALEAALDALLTEPSLCRPPADWFAAAAATQSGKEGPMQWPAWAARAAPPLPGALPVLQLSVPVELVDTEEAADVAVARLCGEDAIGVDAEWCPGASRAALLQLASRSRAFVWDLLRLDEGVARSALRRLFETPRPLKLGFGFQAADWPQLAPWLPAALGVLDLDRLWSRARPLEPVVGLKGLVAKTLLHRVDKSEQCSAWEVRPLTERQLLYAALDAHCLVLVWDALQAAPGDVEAVVADLRRSGAAVHAGSQV